MPGADHLPVPQAERDPVVFEQKYYERLHEIEERHWWAVGMRHVMRALLAPEIRGRRGLRILDAGCGTGLLLREMHASLDASSEPLGIDVAMEGLAFCRRRGARSLAQASALRLPLTSGSFDLAVCIDTLQHVSPAGADRALLEELGRVLAPGGVLYLRTNSAAGRRRLHGVDPEHYRRYTTKDVAAMLRETGFEVRRATYVNAMASIPATVRELLRPPQHHHAHGPGLAIRNLPPHLRWLNPLLLGVMRFEAFLLARGIDLPFGHSTAFVAVKRGGSVDRAS